MNEAALGRRLRASGLWAACGRILSGILLLVLHGVLARSLSGGAYGRYVLIESMALLMSTVCLAGVPAVTLRMIRARLTAGDGAAASQVVTSSVCLLCGTSLVTLAATVAVSQLTSHALPGGLSRAWIPWLAGWAVLAAGLRLLSEIYRGYDRYSVAYCIGGQSGGLLVNFWLLLLSLAAIITGTYSLQTMLAFQVSVQVVFLLLSVGEIRSQFATLCTPRTILTGGLLLSSAWPLLAEQLVSVGLPEAGKLLLGAYSTPEATGLYNATVRLVLLAHVPLLVVNSAIQPFVAELYSSGQRNKLMILTRGSATLAALPCSVVLSVFFLFPESALQFTFGAEFIAAAPALRILALGSLAWVLSGSCGLVLMMTGRERSCMLGTIIPGVVYLIVCPEMIQRFGVSGAAACATALQIASNALCMLLVYYHHRIWTGVTWSVPIVKECCAFVRRRRR